VSQEFPEDDQLEDRLAAIQAMYDEVQAKATSESQALDLLRRAETALKICQEKLQEAKSYTFFDIYAASTINDMMERNALTLAQSLASNAAMLVSQARQASENVNVIGPLTFADGHMIKDIFFDNIFTDFAFQTKIDDVAAEVRRAYSKLESEIVASSQRASATNAELVKAAGDLSQCRSQLDAFRRATFDKVAFAASEDPSMVISSDPPSFDA